jgi:hypothetical protein
MKKFISTLIVFVLLGIPTLLDGYNIGNASITKDVKKQYRQYRTLSKQINFENPEITRLYPTVKRTKTKDATYTRFMQLIEAFDTSLYIESRDTTTLISQNVSVPVTVTNNFPVEIIVKVVAKARKNSIVIHEYPTATLAPNSNTQVLIPVSALISENNSISVQLESSSGIQISNIAKIKTTSIVEIGTAIFWIFIIALGLLLIFGIYRTITKSKRNDTREQHFIEEIKKD